MIKLLLTLQIVASLFRGGLSSNLIDISYNGITESFEESDCTVDILADYFELDPESEITLECSCGSTILPNENGLFEGLSSEDTYECGGTPEDNDCECIETEVIDLSLLNNWYENGARPARAVKSGNTVQLSGVVGHANFPSNNVFLLPEGWRPIYTMIYDQSTYNYGRVRFEVNADGYVSCVNTWFTPTGFHLNQIIFIVAD